MLFILSLAGLSHQRSAKAGNTAGKIGMALALAATVLLALLDEPRTAGLSLDLVSGDVPIDEAVAALVAGS